MMNRKDFKNLLTEWKQNFINERSIDDINWKQFNTKLPEYAKDFAKSIDFPLHVLVLPLPDTYFGGERLNAPLFKNVPNMKPEFEKSESSFQHIKKEIKEFYRFTENLERTKMKRDNLRKNPLYGIEGSREESNIYRDEVFSDFDQNFLDPYDYENLDQEIDDLFERNKGILTGSSGDNIPVCITFQKLLDGDAAAGGLFRFSDLDQDVGESMISWLFHHDLVGHSFGAEARKIFGDTPEEVYAFRFIKIKGLSASLHTGDHPASVMPKLITKSENEIDAFLRKNHVTYEELKKDERRVAKKDFSDERDEEGNRIIKPTLAARILEDPQNFEKYKEENIKNIKSAIEKHKVRLKDWCTKNANKIIIVSYDLH